MQFHLEFDIKKMQRPIDHRQQLVLVGSCFTENIGEKLKQYKFHVLENPNGILFNPISVAEAITSYVENTRYTEDDLFYYNEAWHSWKHHSRYSALTAAGALEKINTATEEAHSKLASADQLMITLGSAWVYTLTEKAPNARQGKVAANNHKGPSEWFYRRLLSTEEVLSILDNMLHRLFLFNPGLQIIFTISPVRHLREGLIENNRSKAVLIQAVHHLTDKFNRLYYFPAYELVIDDLRDYRFYAEDLVHPNYAATNYVWEKFREACMEEDTRKIMEELHSINLAFRHRAFNPGAEAHQQFLCRFAEKAIALQNRYPFLDLEKEIEFFEQSRS